MNRSKIRAVLKGILQLLCYCVVGIGVIGLSKLIAVKAWGCFDNKSWLLGWVSGCLVSMIIDIVTEATKRIKEENKVTQVTRYR